MKKAKFTYNDGTEETSYHWGKWSYHVEDKMLMRGYSQVTIPGYVKYIILPAAIALATYLRISNAG